MDTIPNATEQMTIHEPSKLCTHDANGQTEGAITAIRKIVPLYETGIVLKWVKESKNISGTRETMTKNCTSHWNLRYNCLMITKIIHISSFTADESKIISINCIKLIL
jgi:hypothetical protein